MPNPTPLRLISLIAALALLLALGLTAQAVAIPGDPPIAVLSPPNGATVKASSEPIEVSFACPAYTKEAGGEEDTGEDEEPKKVPPVPGTFDDYAMRFSTSPALGPDGLLTTQGFDELSAEPLLELAADKLTCSGELELPTTPDPAPLYQGIVYWQAYRSCEGCASEYETGPASSFAVVPNVEEPELSLPDHIYAGYLTEIGFSSASDLSGATIVLQRFSGSEWREIDRRPVDPSGGVSFFLKLAAGPGRLRAVVAGGATSLALEPKGVFVAKSARRSVGKDDVGRYQAAVKSERKTAPLRFALADEGRVLRHLRARVQTTCTAGAASVPLTATVGLRAARVAPDGSVVGEMTSKGATPAQVTLVGDLHDGHFSGELTTSFLNCSGTRELEAEPVTP